MRSRKRHIGIILFVVIAACICGLLATCMKRYEFRDPHAALADHIFQDFGVSLPKSVKVPKAYWVFARDGEHVFELTLDARDTSLFMDQISAAAKSRKYKLEISTPDYPIRIQPAY